MTPGDITDILIHTGIPPTIPIGIPSSSGTIIILTITRIITTDTGTGIGTVIGMVITDTEILTDGTAITGMDTLVKEDITVIVPS